MAEIIPTIIPKDVQDLEEKMSNVLGLAPIVQVDVLDGSLVPLRSWPYQSFSKRDAFFESIIAEREGFPFWEKLEFEAHLMVQAPERIISDWIAAGASRIIIQIEGAEDFSRSLLAIADRVPVGVSFALDTPNEKFAPLAKDVAILQLMGWNFSHLGKQGEPFDERAIERVRQLRHEFPEHIVEVDGGVNLENAPKLIAAGADRLVVGSALWKGGNVSANFAEFSSIIKG